MSKKNIIETEAQIIEAFPNAIFTVKLPNNKMIKAYISGKIRIHHIHILPGDKVKISLSPYDLNRARIIYRFKEKDKSKEKIL